MKNAYKLKDLIIKEIDFSKVLLDYNVEFTYNPELVDEVQLKCPFHGRDVKPSARYYRESQRMFCWVCRRSWDVIQFIRDKEGYSFKGALLYIVNKYQLDVSVIPDDPDLFSESNKTVSVDSVKVINIEKRIKGFRNKISYKKYGVLVTAYYMILYKLSKGGDISGDLKKFKSKLNTIKIG
jgi:hypothetical protein